ncbi:MAG: AAA family ATPase [Bacteroidota bacterium]
MRIQAIRLVNYKGVEDKELFFNDRMTVLIGDNGTGKSSFLDAISICLGTILSQTGAQFGTRGSKHRPLFEDEVRKVIMSPSRVVYTDVLLEGCVVSGDREIDWKRDQDRTSKSLNLTEAKGLLEIGTSIANHVDQDTHLPILLYRSMASSSHKLSEILPSDSRLDGYHTCLDPKNDEYVALQADDEKLFNVCKHAIISTVPEWKDLQFREELGEPIVQKEDGSWVSFSNLSEGYRGVINLVVDISYRAITLNPHIGSDVLKETEGIVLIDDIDTHLHPNIQRGIIERLKTTFPKIQFIATTHSPFIVQSLKANEVFNLDGHPIDEHPDTMSLEKIALFMGVESVESKAFHQKEKLAVRFVRGIVAEEEEEDPDLAQLIKHTDDPVFKAKLELARLAKLHSK